VAEAIETNDKIYDLYPPVDQYPSVKTRIAFKILQLGDDFCPTMSEFKEGTLVNVDRTTGESTIELDKAFVGAFDQPSKFYTPDDDNIEQGSTTVNSSCLTHVLLS
jgi:hypothetical protein